MTVFLNLSSWFHIIQAKSLRALNALKFLSHPTLGCNRKRLLPLYTTLVRSIILDYSVPIYGLSPQSQLSLLQTVQNAAILYCNGASTPALLLTQVPKPVSLPWSFGASSWWPTFFAPSYNFPWYPDPQHSLWNLMDSTYLPKRLYTHSNRPQLGTR